MEKRILLAGGGSSGGHGYPLMSVAHALRQQQPAIKLLLIGDDRKGFLQRISRESNIPYKSILAGGFDRYASFSLLLNCIKVPLGFIQSLWHVFWFMPDAVFSKGGYDSVAPALVARLYMIPVYLHESDTVPGWANRLVARLAKTVFVSFPSASVHFPGKAVLVGNPVRPELFQTDRASALQSFDFSSERKTILILGGSQGAKQINDIIIDSLVELVKEYQVIHQCGDTQYDAVRVSVDTFEKEGAESYGPLIRDRYRLYPFLNGKEMAMAYAAADVIISRAGAGSIFEIAQAGKPAIIIPIQDSANNHQVANAVEFAKAGALVLEGANMTTHILINQIQMLLEPARYAAVSEKIRSFATPNAAAAIASHIL